MTSVRVFLVGCITGANVVFWTPRKVAAVLLLLCVGVALGTYVTRRTGGAR